MIEPVGLTDVELDYGGQLGVLRWLEAVRQQCKDNCPNDDGIGYHVVGAWGEMAYAKTMGVYYVPTVNTFKVPDVAGMYIRTAQTHRGSLIIRPKDPPKGTFVLVTMDVKQWPFEFRVRGSFDRLKVREEWKDDPGQRGKPAWFVPQSELSPVMRPIITAFVPLPRGDWPSEGAPL